MSFSVPLVSSGSTMGGMRSGSSSSLACSPVARSRLRSRKSGTSMAKSTKKYAYKTQLSNIQTFIALQLWNVTSKSFVKTHIYEIAFTSC